KFTFDHLKELERKGKTIKTVMAYMENNAKMRYKGKTHVTQVAGVGPQYQEIRSQKVISGSFFTLAQYNSSKRVCVLGATVVEKLFAQTNPLGKKITIADQQYTVLGVLEEKGSLGGIDMDDQVFIPATTALRQFDMEYIQSFLVQSENPQVIPQTINEIEKILLKYFDEDEFSVLDTKNILQAISQVLSALTLALAGIAAISLVVGGIGIMNIMLVSVTERTREIGLRKAVGAKPKDILFQFLVEAVILSLVGGILGISFGVLGSLLLRKFIKTAITSWSIIIAFSVSALVGVIFGVAPAAKAAKLDPIESLRYE
ncbi:MAG TPA: ABC transporter permease, partial [Candidatus Bathyarchaeia archaeon]|nr:ABC transporter permease [Candidatus Bathyarchaeia archaeon]